MTTNTQDYKKEDLSEIEVEIDCAPGSARPDAILATVLSSLGTELVSEDFVKTRCFFGEWTFVLKKGKEAEYEKLKAEIGKSLSDLYKKGALRYASW